MNKDFEPNTTNTGNQSSATKAKNKYNRKAYDRLYSFVKSGNKEKIEQAAKAAGQSLNDYVITAVYDRMEKEGWFLTDSTTSEK